MWLQEHGYLRDAFSTRVDTVQVPSTVSFWPPPSFHFPSLTERVVTRLTWGSLVQAKLNLPMRAVVLSEGPAMEGARHSLREVHLFQS